MSMVTGAGRARQAFGHFWLVECEHLLSEKVGEQDDGIAVRAIAAQPNTACEGVAV